MSSVANAPTPNTPVTADPLSFNRILSVDIFRGLTMILMIFVNDLSSVQGLPRWNYHAHAFEDRMTYVDMVFPAFLFILGGAIPLAIRRRLQRNPSVPSLLGHIVVRSFALLVLGLILANGGRALPSLMHGLPTPVWTLLALFGAILLWAVYPRNSPRQSLFRALRLLGLVLLVAMAVLFRRTTRTGAVAWIDLGYPEILGLLAVTYLCSSILFLLTRRWAWAPAFWLVVALVFNCLESAKVISFPNHVSLYAWPFSNGSMVLCAMAGMLTTETLFGPIGARLGLTRRRLLTATAIALVLLLLGLALKPLGISKIRATPTWGLWSAGASALILTALHWIADLRHHTRWAAPAMPPGTNTLLTYLLPDMIYFAMLLVGFSWQPTGLASGLPGLARAVLFTAAIVGLSALLTRARIRLQL